jgi:hypothetical protein
MQQSGTSKIPSIIAYPEILHIDRVPELKDRLVYIIRSYKLDGTSILIFRNSGKIGIRFGDFAGNIIEPEKLDKKFAANYVGPLVDLMNRARIPQAQFYFSGDILVDIRTHLDKMSGPGMVKELCSKIIPTQEIIAIKKLDDGLLKELPSMGQVILKHSSFKIIVRGDKFLPLYARSG